ncbi:MAG: UDP-2,3-diacylglucosamine diphosphatase [Gammaproteobacteria bacterium]|nr:MAG: UDP-2,3-diacylglucosamine diphosphatase [Gammaproteobacteria bacterium]
MGHKTLFISDLHLEENYPDTTQRFLALLKNCDASIDAIYILGDLFEAWIGDDDDTPFHRDIIHALRAVTQTGLPIYFMRGNRDFLIGKKFLQATGCKMLPDEEKINLYGTAVLLMHGDTLCTRDIAYLKWRKKSRHPILNTLLFSMWPLAFRRWFANKMRVKSMLHTQSAAKEIMDVTQEEVERVMQKHRVYYLIHGHTHRLGTHEFTLNQTQATRMVLGAWHQQGSVLEWNQDGKKLFFNI